MAIRIPAATGRFEREARAEWTKSRFPARCTPRRLRRGDEVCEFRTYQRFHHDSIDDAAAVVSPH